MSQGKGPDDGRAAQGLVARIMQAVEQYNRETGLAPPPADPPKRPARRRKGAEKKGPK